MQLEEKQLEDIPELQALVLKQGDVVAIKVKGANHVKMQRLWEIFNQLGKKNKIGFILIDDSLELYCVRKEDNKDAI